MYQHTIPSEGAHMMTIDVVDNGFIVRELSRSGFPSSPEIYVFNTPSDLADHVRGWGYDSLCPTATAVVPYAAPVECPF